MIIQSVSHRGLRRLIEEDNPRLIGRELANRVRVIITALRRAEDISRFVERAPRGWRVHRLARSRGSEWSVSVSGNWRITFEIEGDRVYNLSLEDYH